MRRSFKICSPVAGRFQACAKVELLCAPTCLVAGDYGNSRSRHYGPGRMVSGGRKAYSESTPQPMASFFYLFALTQTFGVFFLLEAICSAPEGYEDEAGFHFGHRPALAPKLCRAS